MVIGLIQQVDTTNIFNSYLRVFEIFKKNISDFENKYNAWFNTIKTDILDKKYYDFDNFTYRSGYIYSYTKQETEIEKIIKETINNKLDNSIYATRINTIKETEIKTDTECKAQNVKFIETYKLKNGSWELEIV